ncbi:MAG TPA: Uma2 family endonuclease [Isosphaeraceae bacterium]|nr:Uma2 family endonuclease [Isosphaeraceae bacterium]
MSSVMETSLPELQENGLGPETATEPVGLYEVIEGQVREKPQMGAYESVLANVLKKWLDKIVESNQLGQAFTEVLFLIDRETKLQLRPDVAFVTAERWPLDRRPPRGKAAWEIIPDLAVEVISPTNRTLDDFMKIHQYFHAGVRLVWMVLPSVDQVYVFHSPTKIQVLGRGNTLEGGSVVPGFQVDLNDLFGNEEVTDPKKAQPGP